MLIQSDHPAHPAPQYPSAQSALLMTLSVDARDRPHDDDITLGRWTLNADQAHPDHSGHLTGQLTEWIETGAFDHANQPGQPETRRQRYRVAHVRTNPADPSSMIFQVTRSDRMGNSRLLTFRAQIETIPGFPLT